MTTTTIAITTTAKPATDLVGDVCLYGNGRIGHGWIASHKGGMLGDGEPRACRGMTEAIWLAVEALRAAGVTEGKIAIHAPGGERFTVVDIGGHVGYAGDLRWSSSATLPQVTIGVVSL